MFFGGLILLKKFNCQEWALLAGFWGSRFSVSVIGKIFFIFNQLALLTDLPPRGGRVHNSLIWTCSGQPPPQVLDTP